MILKAGYMTVHTRALYMPEDVINQKESPNIEVWSPFAFAFGVSGERKDPPNYPFWC